MVNRQVQSILNKIFTLYMYCQIKVLWKLTLVSDDFFDGGVDGTMSLGDITCELFGALITTRRKLD
jgi:hypothetical protein